MEKIPYSAKPMITKSGRVMVRVRWNKKQCEAMLSADTCADPSKWNAETGKAKLNTTHIVNGEHYYAKDINGNIEDVLNAVEEVFYNYQMKNIMPLNSDIRDSVKEMLHKEQPKKKEIVTEKSKYLKDLLKEYLEKRPLEVTWGPKAHCRYEEAYDKYCMAMGNKNVKLCDINKKSLLKWKQWFFSQNYSNQTSNKTFRNLKGLLRWGRENGYLVEDEALAFKPNIILGQKTVIFLTQEEIIQFENYQFDPGKEHLARIRDVFLFSCYTGLRHSDLYNLRPANIQGDVIDIVTQKGQGKERVYIPILPQARAILERYKGTLEWQALPVISDQKSNVELREAAQAAGLNREIVQEQLVGGKRVSKTSMLWEILSMHCGRRTFVCTSLAFGMPPSTVAKVTGHNDLNSMKPYIGVADSTLKHEMKRWITSPLRQEIDAILDGADEESLKKYLEILKKMNKNEDGTIES